MAMETLSVQNPAPSLDRILDHLIRYLESLQEDGITGMEFPMEKAALPNPVAEASPCAEPAARDTQEPPTDKLSAKTTLSAIASQIAACTRCSLHQTRTQTVPGQGHSHPDILFIGEGPGEDEDKQGLAFVGRAGQMLTRLITRMGYTRDEVFIANVVKCRPPENRKPLPEEMEACRPYLREQIAALKPKIIVTLGATALEGLTASQEKVFITRLRGKWLSYENIPLMPTFHPSYLLRNESAMWDVWNDMQEVLKHLGRTPPPKKSG